MNSTMAAFIQPIAIELGQPPQIYQSYAIVTWSPPTAKLCLLLAWGEQWIFHHGQQIIPHSSSGQTGKTQTWDLFGGQEDSNRDGEQCFHSGCHPVTSGVPQGLVLCSTLGNTFPNDLDGRTERIDRTLSRVLMTPSWVLRRTHQKGEISERPG